MQAHARAAARVQHLNISHMTPFEIKQLMVQSTSCYEVDMTRHLPASNV